MEAQTKVQTILIAEDDLDDQYLIRTAFESIVPPGTVHMVENGNGPRGDETGQRNGGKHRRRQWQSRTGKPADHRHGEAERAAPAREVEDALGRPRGECRADLVENPRSVEDDATVVEQRGAHHATDGRGRGRGDRHARAVSDRSSQARGAMPPMANCSACRAIMV